MACIHPHVHLNGTDRASLIADKSNQWTAVKNALYALQRTGPHMRDYYPEPGLWDDAIAEHESRLTVLADLLDDIEAEYQTLIDGAHNGK